MPLPRPPVSAVGAVRRPGGVVQAEAAALSLGSLPGGVGEGVVSTSRISERYPLHEGGEVRLLRPRPLGGRVRALQRRPRCYTPSAPFVLESAILAP